MERDRTLGWEVVKSYRLGVLAAVLAMVGAAAHAQSIFDQSASSNGPFTTKFIGDAGGTSAINNAYSTFIQNNFLGPNICAQGGINCYIYSRGVSSGGSVVGAAGFNEIVGPEVPIIWSPSSNTNGPQFGAAVTALPMPSAPASLPGTTALDGSATGIDSAGKIISGMIGFGADPADPFNITSVLPYYWKATTAGNFTAAPNLLPLLAGNTDGGAFGVSDGGRYITGWSGTYVPLGTGIMQAVLWDLNNLASPTSLGATPDPINSPASRGNAVADNKTVVGWYGIYPQSGSFDAGFTNDVNFINGPTLLGDQSVFGINFATQWKPKPFVWTQASGTMMSLMNGAGNLTSKPDFGYSGTQPTYSFGEARAINAGGSTLVGASPVGTVAVGWLGNSRDGGTAALPNYEAMRWSTTNNWSTYATLQLAPVSLTTLKVADGTAVSRLGSVANGVDASGTIVVGRTEYCTNSAVDCNVFFGVTGAKSQATVWEVAADGQSSTANTITSILAAVGISSGNIFFTDATGVRVVANSPPEDILIVGNGTRTSDNSPDIFLVRLQRPAPTTTPTTTPTPPQSGLTSLLEQEASLSTLGLIGNQFVGAGDSAIRALATAADYYRCTRPRGAEESQVWCGFAYGVIGLYNGNGQTGQEYAGTVGLARYFSPATSVGVSISAASLYERLGFGGSFDAPGAMFGAYFSHHPDLGLQLLAMGVLGLYPHIDVSRGYPNGAGLAFSDGTTRSTTGGLMGRIGWSLPFWANIIATPFAQISYLDSRVGGWTESGGPFPATISSFSASSTTSRLGTQLRAPVSDTVTLFGALTWAHLLASQVPTVTGSLIVADCNGTNPLLAFCGITGVGPGMTTNWGEATAGFKVELSPTSVASLSGTVAAGSGFTSYIAQVGYSQAF